MSDNQELLIPVAHAAARVNLSAKTVRRLIRAGKFPSKRIGIRWFVPVKALEEWANTPDQVATQLLDNGV